MKKIGQYFLKRLFLLLTILIAVILFTFILVELSPIDPIQSYVSDAAISVSPEQREMIAENWGLYDPPLERLYNWFASLLSGDFGESLIIRQPVITLIWKNVKSSFIILSTAWFLSGVIGYLAGVIAGYYPHSRISRIITNYSIILNSMPRFWVALLLMYLVAVKLKLLPVALSSPLGVVSTEVNLADKLRHATLPIITLVLTSLSDVILYTKSRVIELTNSKPILFARANGFSDREIIKNNVLRQTLVPAVTLQFTKFGHLFSGAVLIEEIYSYPGLGQLTITAGLSSDLPLLLGIVFFSAIVVYTGNTVAEIINIYADPRLRTNGG